MVKWPSYGPHIWYHQIYAQNHVPKCILPLAIELFLKQLEPIIPMTGIYKISPNLSLDRNSSKNYLNYAGIQPYNIFNTSENNKSMPLPTESRVGRIFVWTHGYYSLPHSQSTDPWTYANVSACYQISSPLSLATVWYQLWYTPVRSTTSPSRAPRSLFHTWLLLS